MDNSELLSRELGLDKALKAAKFSDELCTRAKREFSRMLEGVAGRVLEDRSDVSFIHNSIEITRGRLTIMYGEIFNFYFIYDEHGLSRIRQVYWIEEV